MVECSSERLWCALVNPQTIKENKNQQTVEEEDEISSNIVVFVFDIFSLCSFVDHIKYAHKKSMKRRDSKVSKTLILPPTFWHQSFSICFFFSIFFAFSFVVVDVAVVCQQKDFKICPAKRHHYSVHRRKSLHFFFVDYYFSFHFEFSIEQEMKKIKKKSFASQLFEHWNACRRLLIEL